MKLKILKLPLSSCHVFVVMKSYTKLLRIVRICLHKLNEKKIKVRDWDTKSTDER